MASHSAHRTRVANDAKGMVLAVILLLMGLLGLLGMAFLTSSLTDIRIASNETDMMRALNIAEAGLERGKARVRNGTEGSINNFLPASLPNPAGGNPGPNLYTNMGFANGSYNVTIEDDLGLPVDNNERVFIRSRGSFGTAQKEILVLARVVKAPPMPTPRGAAETLANPGASSEIHAEPGAFDGRDWTPPADIGTCIDATCGTKISDTGTYGAVSNLAAISYAQANNGTMYGTGCTSGACGLSVATSSHLTDTSIPTTRWDPYIDAMKLRANQTHSAADLASGNTYTWGTQANPQITVINTDGSFDWKAKVTGAGVLIIEAGPTTPQRSTFSGSGELNWVGLVIIRSPANFEYEVQKKDSLNVFGIFVNRSLTRAEIELKQDDNFIKYSSAAVNMVNQKLGAIFQVLSWREVTL